jgi:hypothetical protein
MYLNSYRIWSNITGRNDQIWLKRISLFSFDLLLSVWFNFEFSWWSRIVEYLCIINLISSVEWTAHGTLRWILFERMYDNVWIEIRRWMSFTNPMWFKKFRMTFSVDMQMSVITGCGLSNPPWSFTLSRSSVLDWRLVSGVIKYFVHSEHCSLRVFAT